MLLEVIGGFPLVCVFFIGVQTQSFAALTAENISTICGIKLDKFEHIQACAVG